MGYRWVLWRRAVQEQRWTSGGIHRQERLELLQAVNRVRRVAASTAGHNHKTTPACAPTTAACAEFCPDGSEQRAAQLLRLVDQKCQPPRHGKRHGEMLLAMAVVVLKVVAWIFQGIECRIFNLPPSTSTSHQAINSALAHPQVCYPAKVLGLPIAYLPILNKIDPHVRVRGLERHIVDKAKPMHHPSGAVMALRTVTRPACSAACTWVKRWA